MPHHVDANAAAALLDLRPQAKQRIPEIDPERMPIEQALRNFMDALCAANQLMYLRAQTTAVTHLSPHRNLGA